MTNCLQGIQAGCGCAQIHDISLRAEVSVDADGEAGIFIGPEGSTTSIFNLYGLGFRSPEEYGLSTPSVGETGYTTFASGQKLQLSVYRSGLTCVDASGDYYSNPFSGTLDSGWTTSGPNTFSIVGGRLQCTMTSTGKSFFYRTITYNFSDTANYSVGHCANGSEVTAALDSARSWTGKLSSSLNPTIFFGVFCEPLHVGSVASWANLFADFDA